MDRRRHSRNVAEAGTAVVVVAGRMAVVAEAGFTAAEAEDFTAAEAEVRPAAERQVARRVAAVDMPSAATEAADTAVARQTALIAVAAEYMAARVRME